MASDNSIPKVEDRLLWVKTYRYHIDDVFEPVVERLGALDDTIIHLARCTVTVQEIDEDNVRFVLLNRHLYYPVWLDGTLGAEIDVDITRLRAKGGIGRRVILIFIAIILLMIAGVLAIPEIGPEAGLLIVLAGFIMLIAFFLLVRRRRDNLVRAVVAHLNQSDASP